jgi:predicted DNA-binding transcriptional regulator AlpA
MPAAADRLLPLAEVADLLRVSPDVLYQWRKREQGPPSFRIGRLVRYRASALTAWIDAQEAATTKGGE